MKVVLQDIAASVSYGVTASACDEPVGPKFLRITDIQDDRVCWDDVPWCKFDSKGLDASRLESGDIVFARTGATTGKSFLINQRKPPALPGDSYSLTVPGVGGRLDTRRLMVSKRVEILY